MYENKNKALAPVSVFYGRLLKNLFTAGGLLTLCLMAGILGYHYLGKMSWINAIHNASMILSGMGPVIDEPEKLSVAGKLFSSAYALFSGVAFITNIGFIMAPAVHRFLHKLHMEEK